MSGLLGDAITSFFGGTPAQAQQAPQAAPAPMPTYDMWGRPVAPLGAPQQATPTAGLLAQQAPSTPGPSGYDMWGRQAPAPAAPAMPGLGDLLAMVQAAQAQQQQQDTSGAVRAMTGNYG